MTVTFQKMGGDVMRARSIGIAFFFATCSMAPVYTVTKTTADAAPAKAGDCDFAIATTKFDRAYKEVAILDAQALMAHDATEFKDAIRKDVCALGGDAVYAEINGRGFYARGTVVRWTEGRPQ